MVKENSKFAKDSQPPQSRFIASKPLKFSNLSRLNLFPVMMGKGRGLFSDWFGSLTSFNEGRNSSTSVLLSSIKAKWLKYLIILSSNLHQCLQSCPCLRLPLLHPPSSHCKYPTINRQCYILTTKTYIHQWSRPPRSMALSLCLALIILFPKQLLFYDAIISNFFRFLI